MEGQLVETLVLTAVFVLCVFFIARKGMAKFSKNGGSGCGSGCGGCSSSQQDTPCDTSGGKSA